jgi:hypothetical protein
MPRKTRGRVETVANVTISFWTSNAEDGPPRGFEITIEDQNSGTRMVEVEMAPEQFALALASCTNQPAKATYYLNPYVGKNIECKTIGLEMSDTLVQEPKALKIEALKEAARPFEVEGWKASHAHADNPRYWTYDRKTGMIAVVTNFRRYLDPKTGEPVIIGEQEDAEG